MSKKETKEAIEFHLQRIDFHRASLGPFVRYLKSLISVEEYEGKGVWQQILPVMTKKQIEHLFSMIDHIERLINLPTGYDEEKDIRPKEDNTKEIGELRGAISAISANYPPSNYSMLREALDISMDLIEEKISQLIEERKGE